jgi:putative hydrolase of the HAD superfamily
MSHDIEAIFLDVGNTLRILVKDEPYQSQAREKIVAMLGTNESPDVFCRELDRRYKIYRKWAFENMVEASETELWTRWLAPEYSTELTASQALELTYQFRKSMGRRVMAEDGKQVVEELYKRGYVLGIISNVITSQEIPNWLEEDGLAKYFKSVALSSVLGKRKPDPAIYKHAAAFAGMEPARCAYVGDNPKRDVVGTRKAGFGMVIIMLDVEAKNELIAERHKPDLIIQRLGDLLDYFPPR